MKRALFSSVDGGQAHPAMIVGATQNLGLLASASSDSFEIQIMVFAFTDPEIADAIEALVACHENVQVKIIADWSQGAPKSPSVVSRLQAHPTGRIALKYKIDLPYFVDKSTGRVRWGYHTSHGMLHHKTLLIRRAGVVTDLILGSFNWGARGTQSYENTLQLGRDGATAVVLDAFEAEFAALWHDPAMTATPEAAGALALAARRKVQAGGSMHNVQDIVEVLGQSPAETLARETSHLAQGTIIPAFSGRRLTSVQAHYGFAAANNARNLDLLRPSGARRPAPCSVNAVALDAIRSVPAGARIRVAMYAMSPRVPEYAALLEAAQRGCPIDVLLDRKIGAAFAEELSARAQAEHLPITVRATNRRMHQKYIVAPESQIVVTGTANMTEDSAHRHAEHRVLFRNDPTLATAFDRDFETIWRRVA